MTAFNGTMTEVSQASTNDIYDPDDVGLRDSPPLRALKPKLDPTPSPPPEAYESDNSPARSDGTISPKGRRVKSVPSQGDAVLLGLLGGGEAPEVAHTASQELLASDDEEMSEGLPKGVEMNAVATTAKPAPPSDLEALAAGALKFHAAASHAADALPDGRTPGPANAVPSPHTNGVSEVAADISTIQNVEVGDSLHRMSPPPTADSNSANELAPIQELSPKSDGRQNGMTLPSISDHLGGLANMDLKHLAEAATVATDQNMNGVHRPSFSQSPPRPPLFQVPQPGTGGHVSPPISPNDSFHRELPSPGRVVGPASSYYYGHAHRSSTTADGLYSSTTDYSSSTTETPSTDHSTSTPAGIPVGLDRMSIDGITNPQIGGFQCTYAGCTAQPFQTQYLLNSHANVHSSNRPHYCPVKGCPRSEGGKGFKRKNEMIRHGLVHESPGYVCPYCVDREHRYPRPDNLQRSVPSQVWHLMNPTLISLQACSGPSCGQG